MKKWLSLFLIVSLLVVPIVFGYTNLKEMRDGQGYVTNDDSDAFYYKYDLSVELNEGWNLVSTFSGPKQILPTSEIKDNNIKAVYYYSPLQNQYVDWLSVMQGKSEIPSWWDSQDANIANGGSMWVYSNKDGVLKYWADDFKQRRILVNGWNFIAVTPEMAEVQSPGMYTFPVTFEQSGCSVSKVYTFDSKKQSWEKVEDFETGGNAIGKEFMGVGLVMKISTNNELCVWTPGEQDVSGPPSLPN